MFLLNNEQASMNKNIIPTGVYDIINIEIVNLKSLRKVLNDKEIMKG